MTTPNPISWRRKAGRATGLLLALAFAALLVPIATLESWTGLTDLVREGQPSPITVRLPEPVSSDLFVKAGRILIRRGEVVGPDQAALFRRLYVDGKLEGLGAALGLFVAFALIGILLNTHVRTTQRGRLLRVQGTVLASFALMALVFKLYLLLTPLSAFLLPAAALGVLLGLVVERNVGLGGAIALAIVLSAMTPFDASLAVVLAAQGVAAVLACSRGKRRRYFLYAGAAAAGAAAGAYVAIVFLLEQRMPLGELAHPFHSPLVAAALGGLLVGPIAILLRPGVEGLLGEIPKARLVELADLENPLLKQIAQKSPGTWQHSLAMANMAESAANAIGANALLIRVGAYYHDLGKSLSSGHFIENMTPGGPSPHDAMTPEKSAEAIFSHVTEGVRLAREKGLPEAVIDFMHMHHGDGLLEYFWAKCLEMGNPRKLSVKNFRYPGVKPQTRETAILAICDAVEAASRSLKQPGARSVEALVQRIVYGKLHLGQLDESGLTVAELKAIADVLVDTLKHAHHIRVEYPWQKEEAKMAAAAAATPDEALATTQPRERGDTTQKFIVHSLDSADLPRPYWGASGSDLDDAITRQMPRNGGKAAPAAAEAAGSTPPVAAQASEAAPPAPEPELFPLVPGKPRPPPPPAARDATKTTPMRAAREPAVLTEEISEDVEPAPEPIEVRDATPAPEDLKAIAETEPEAEPEAKPEAGPSAEAVPAPVAPEESGKRRLQVLPGKALPPPAPLARMKLAKKSVDLVAVPPDEGEVIALDRPKSSSASSPPVAGGETRAPSETPLMVAEAEPLPPRPVPEAAPEELSSDDLIEDVDPVPEIEPDDEKPTTLRPPFRTAGPPPGTRSSDPDEDLVPTRVTAVAEESSSAHIVRATLPPRSNPPPRHRVATPAPTDAQKREVSEALETIRRELEDE